VNVGLRSPLSHRATNAARRSAAAVARGERELPTYFVIGAKRAGTTSLNEYLVQHPNVQRGLVEKGSRYFDVNFGRGWGWFTRNFPSTHSIDRIERRTGVRPILGESSPYYCYHPEAPARIAARLPEARLVMLVREPVARAWSHYHYERTLGIEPLGIHDALDQEDARLATGTPQERAHADRHFGYVARSQYADQIERVRRHFPGDQLLVLESEALFRDPQGTMDVVYEHVGLPAYQGDFSSAFKQNRYDEVPDDVVARLAPLMEASTARLPGLGVTASWLSSA